jgi:hypothetical protein
LQAHFIFCRHTNQHKKNKKSLQASAPDNANIRSNLTWQTNGRKEERTDNKGFKEIGGSVVNQTFLHLIKCSGSLTVHGSETPTS